MKKDTSLRYPNIVKWAQHLNRTIIVMHVESTLPFGDELPGIVHMGMLMVNVKGQFARVNSLVNPEKKIPAVLSRKLNVTSEVWSKAKSWKEGWFEGFAKMAETSTFVSLQDTKQDFRAVEKQYARLGTELKWLQKISLKQEFLALHPTRSGSTADLTQFYQLAQSGEHTSAERLLLSVNILEIMLGETGVEHFGIHLPVDAVLPAVKYENVSETDILPEDRNLEAIEKLSVASVVEDLVEQPKDDAAWREKLDAARVYLLREACYSRDPVDYFSRIEHQYPVRVMPGNKRINGYSLNIDGFWLRASEISPDLGWNQLLENQAWPFGVGQVSSLSKWFHS